MGISGGVPAFTSQWDAADTVSTDELWPGGATDLDGQRQNKLMHLGWGRRIIDPPGIDSVPELASRIGTESAPWAFRARDASRERWSLRGRTTAQGCHYGRPWMRDWDVDVGEMADAAAGTICGFQYSYGPQAGWVFLPVGGQNFGPGTGATPGQVSRICLGSMMGTPRH